MSPWAGLDDLFNMDIDDESVFPVSLARGHWGPSRFRQPDQFQLQDVRGGQKPVRRRTRSSGSEDDQKWTNTVDMSAFKPENVTVKLAYNQLHIRAHCEKTHPLYGQLEMSASRDFSIPHDVDPKSVRTVFSEGGQLLIEGRRKPLAVTYTPLAENGAKVTPIAINSAQRVEQIKEEVTKAKSDTDTQKECIMEVDVPKEPEKPKEAPLQHLIPADHPTGGSTNLISWFDSMFGGAASLVESPFVKDESGNKKFLVKYDLGDFKPENINVKLVSGNYLKIDAVQEEKDQNHDMYNEFHRTYKIPDGVNTDALAIKLGKDGMLSVSAPILALKDEGERILSITQE